MRTPEENIFFIGFLNDIPKGLRLFLLTACVVLPCLFAGLGFAISATQDDPGDGSFRFDLGRQELVGVVISTPYPTITITQDTEHFSAGQTIMLSGQGKRGAMAAETFDGQLTRVQGVPLTRGDLVMVQLAGGQRGPMQAEGTAPAPQDEDLGRWRVSGEICDGKCLAGAMRPGRGLAHKACANLCLIGDIPPVLALTGPVEGQMFMLIGGPDGGPIPAEMLAQTSVLVEMEGKVVRRGDLLIFHADPATLKVL